MKPEIKQKLKKIFPPLGMRIIKTALSLFIAMILTDYVFKLFLPDLDTTSVCVFAMLSVQDSVKGTWKFVFERFLGNILGLATGFLFLFLFSLTGTTGTDGSITSGNFVFYAFIAVGTMLTIYLCKIVDRASVSAITIIVFLNIMFGASVSRPYLNGAMIVIQLAIGIVVAVSINMLIMPPKGKKLHEKPQIPHHCKDCEYGRQLTLYEYYEDVNNINDMQPEAEAKKADGELNDDKENTK